MSVNIFFILLPFLLPFFTNAQDFDVINCSPHNPKYTIKRGSLTHFESPNFPQTFSNSSYSCSAQLYTETEGQNIWLAMYNGIVNVSSNNGPVSLYNSNFDVQTFVAKSNLNFFSSKASENGKWAAFQAVVNVYDPTRAPQTCPLSGQTFNFSAATPELVIPISSEFEIKYNNNNKTNKHCFWTFTKEESQQLKVVVKNIRFSDSLFSASLYADGILMQKFSSDTADQVFYFNGTVFNIDFQNQKSRGLFFVLVSAVVSKSQTTSKGCYTAISNIDYGKGYPSNQYCNKAITFPAINETKIFVSIDNYESCCDKLFFVDTFGTKWDLSPKTRYMDDYYTVTSGATGSIEFISDGNTQGAGYEVSTTTYECKCNKQAFKMDCNLGIEYFPMHFGSHYCDNMKCSYQFLPNSECLDVYFTIDIDASSIRPNVDSLTLIVNNVSKPIISGYFEGYYSSNTSLQLEFVSGSTERNVYRSNEKAWSAYVVSGPRFRHIDLSKTNSTQILWFADFEVNDAVAVCVSTGYLQIYTQFVWDDSDYYLQQFQLFDSNTILNPVNKTGIPWLTINSLQIRNSSSGCFTVYLPRNQYTKENQYFLLFKNLDSNCQTQSSVFQLSQNINNFGLLSATASGPCEYIILATPPINVGADASIWINSVTVTTTPNNYIFKSTANNNLLLSLNESTANQWQNFGVYAVALSIIVPPSAGINVQFSSDRGSIDNTNYPGTSQKGIMASPSYCGIWESYSSRSLYEDYYPRTMILEIKHRDPHSSDIIVQTDSGSMILKNETTTLQFSYFKLIYSESNATKSSGFLIECSRSAINNTLSTGSSSATNQFTFPTTTSTTPPPPPLLHNSAAATTIQLYPFVFGITVLALCHGFVN